MKKSLADATLGDVVALASMKSMAQRWLVASNIRKKKVDPVRIFMCLFQVEKSLPASSTSYLFLVIDAFGCVYNDALCCKSPKKDAGAIESKPA